ncbi:MAG: hypothetical protein CYPHOPRED_000383 [Cyphobasidiales sp. Tagirdzhanova-0007]|nr:MAG: hypothetical protein CYPHOPRED_000383 [Cyphobasidiales sp. Tagirdzhanova-0007]
MHFIIILISLALTSAALAHPHHHSLPHHHRHNRLARRSSGKCPSRLQVNNETSTDILDAKLQVKVANSQSFTPPATSSPSPSSSNGWQKPAVKTFSPATTTTPSSTFSASASASASSSSFPAGHGLFGFTDPTCGQSGATESVSKTSGPNGAMKFLNFGLDGSGWTPPAVTLDMVLAVSLDEALEDPNSPFIPCKPYLSLFDKYAQQFNLPPILLASIAMQESSCIASATGDDGGAFGLMQITQDKCTTGIDCTDPDYNIKTGAAYFQSVLTQNNGNILLACGQYNGWYQGLTVAKATAIKSQCCECQNNLNYLQQMLNGWLQNIDGTTLGTYDMGC